MSTLIADSHAEIAARLALLEAERLLLLSAPAPADPAPAVLTVDAQEVMRAYLAWP